MHSSDMTGNFKRSAIMVINCGSSSVKFALIDTETELARISGLAERMNSHEAILSWKINGQKESRTLPYASLTDSLGEIIKILPQNVQVIAVGHRVVHGGEEFARSVIIDDEVMNAIKRCAPLAPLHNPVNLAGIQAAQKVFPKLPQVAVFDTAFHQTIPQHAYLYAVPYDWYQEHGVRRYGFHGTSHRFVAGETASRLDIPLDEFSAVIAHLGNGCSACAIEGGKSVDTTMGISPLEGLVMGTRSGDIDPSMHEFIASAKDWSLERIMNALNKESGLLGLSGQSNDMRTLVEASDTGDEQARLAIEVFAYRLAKAIMSLTASLSKLDAIVFTGGIGENSPLVRAKTLEHLRVLGVKLDSQANALNGVPETGKISDERGTPCLVVTTNEELAIARETLKITAP